MAEASTWGPVAYLVPRLSSSNRMPVTATGDALSIIFDDAQVTLDAKPDGLEGSWTGGFAIPAKPSGNTKFVCQLRGFVRKTTATRGVLMATVAGQLTAREFGYGSEAEERIDIDLSFDIASLSAGRVVIVLAVQAERQDFDQSITVQLDSIDASAVAPVPVSGNGATSGNEFP